MNRSLEGISSLGQEHLDEATKVLGRAFDGNPLMKTLFPCDDGIS